jgi:hypothetical protein
MGALFRGAASTVGKANLADMRGRRELKDRRPLTKLVGSDASINLLL